MAEPTEAMVAAAWEAFTNSPSVGDDDLRGGIRDALRAALELLGPCECGHGFDKHHDDHCHATVLLDYPWQMSCQCTGFALASSAKVGER